MSEWISVKKKLPIVNELVLITGFDEVIPGFFSSMDEWCEVGGIVTGLHVTHWMPLPEPPK